MTKTFEKLARAHRSGAVQRHELFYNAMITLISGAAEDVRCRDHWPECLKRFPADLLTDFDSWFAREMDATDCMPDPSPFVANTADTMAMEVKKLELRPHYQMLLDVTRRLAKATHSA